MRKALSLLIAAFALNGCVSNQPKAVKIDTNDSFATRIVKYAHFDTKIKEMPPGVFSDFKKSSNGTPLIDTALIAGYSFSDWTPPLGSADLAVTMSVLNLMLKKPDKITSENSTQILAWMPKDMASSAKEARSLLQELIFNVSKDTLKANNFDWNYLSKHPDALLNTTTIADDTVRVSLDWDNTNKIEPYPTHSTSPDEFGSYDSWAFSQRQMMYNVYFKTNDQLETLRQPSYDYYKKLSSHLPNWVFIYVSPYKMKYSDTIIRPFPVVFNKGKMHLFVTSESKNVIK